MVLRFRQLAREGVTEVVYNLQEQAITEFTTRRTENMQAAKKAKAPAQQAGAQLSKH